jgi:dTDP-4-dehydrorhamnose 3,5-epimerase
LKIVEIPLKGAFLVHVEKIEDFRGFFARAYCYKELEKRGINKKIVQINTSYSYKKGTLRGLHYQVDPHGETKMMRCIQGAIFDVIIDLRPESETFCQWYGVKLSAYNRNMLIVPESFAHGYQTLIDDTEVIYPTTAFYSPEHERGIRWDDSFFNIKWPISDPIISDKDNSFPDFKI